MWVGCPSIVEERHFFTAPYAWAMTTLRLATLGLLLGGLAAVVYHFMSTSHPTGWFAYAPLSDNIALKMHPSWWPTAIVGPLLGGLVGYLLSRIQRLRHHL